MELLGSLASARDLDLDMMLQAVFLDARSEDGSARTAEGVGSFKLLARLALADPLTGLTNRLLLHDRLTQALAQCQRSGGHVAVIFIALGNLRDINDEFGYASGDMVLCEVSRRLARTLRDVDTLSRVSGSEFVAVATVRNEQGVQRLAQRVQAVLPRPIVVAGNTMLVSASIGIALAQDGESAEGVLARADEAMYIDKHSGQGA
jgi:diguanylate cyclase (GGDEF)-like protein